MLSRARLAEYMRGLMLLAVLVVMSGYFALSSPHFLSTANLLNVGLQSATNIVLAVGMTFVIASGGIDLSVGALVAITGVVMGVLARAGLGSAVMLPVGLAVGATGGLCNGLLISKLRVPPFIATLAVMGIARGLALIITGTRAIYGMPAFFRFLGAGRLEAVPVPVFIAAGAALLGWLLMRHTQFGTYTLAMGGNEQAARLAGINIPFWKTMVYVFMGLMSAVTAVIVTARLNTAEPLAGSLYELDAIAVVVIGGTSLSGGVGKVAGTVIAGLILGVLRNGLTMLDVPSAYQQVALGVVIILAVLMDQLKKEARA